MGSAFFLFLATLTDPIRWLISVLAAWLVPNHAGAIATSVVVATGLTLAFVRSPTLASLLAGVIVSAAITSAFFLLRRKLRDKKQRRDAHGPSIE